MKQVNSQFLENMLNRTIIRNTIAMLFYVVILVATDFLLRKQQITDLASVPLYLVVYALAAVCAYWANRKAFISTVDRRSTRIVFILITILTMTLLFVFVGFLATIRF